MRILHVIPGIDPRGGGPSAVLSGLASAQLRQGLDVRVISTWHEARGRPADEVVKAIAAPVRLVGPSTGKLDRHPDLPREVAAAVAEADLVHIHALWEEIQHRAARLSYAAGVPYVITPHGMLTPWSLTQSKWVKRAYLAWRLRTDLDRAAAIHFTTEDERNATRASMKLKPKEIVECVGVDLREFEHLPQRGSFRALHPQTQSRPLIVFLGRIHPGKGLEYLVPAMANLQDRQAMLAVAGPDSRGYRATIEQLAQEHGVADRILFTGMLRGGERVAALADADLFALPSDHENFGVAIVEALAAGRPVIVSDQVGIHRQITSGGVGAVVPCNADAVAREIDRWLADATLREAAAARARPFVWQNFDWDQIARRWAQHYADIIAASSSRPGH